MIIIIRVLTLKQIELKELAEKTDGFSGAYIEVVVKEAIEIAFVDNRAVLTTEQLIQVIDNTPPLKALMKDKVQEYQDKFENLGSILNLLLLFRSFDSLSIHF